MKATASTRAVGIGVVKTLVPNGIAAAISAVAVMLMVRNLPPSDWGGVAATVGIAQFAASMIDLGASTAAVRSLSQQSNRSEQYLAFQRITLGRLTVWRAVLVSGSALWSLFFIDFSWWLVLIVASVFANLGATTLLVSQSRFFVAAMMTVLEKSCSLAIVASAWMMGSVTVHTYPAALAIAATVTCATALWVSGIRKALVWPLWGAAALTIWRGSLAFGIANLAPALLLFDVAIVSIFSDSHEAGLFAIGARLVAPLSIAASAMSTVIFPLFSGTTLSRPSRSALRKASGVSVAILGALLVLLVAADWWIPTLFGERYNGAIWPARLYILNVCVVLFTRTFSTILQSQGREKAVSAFIAISTLLALALIAVGGYVGGATGASFGVLASNVALIFALVLYTVRASVFGPRNEAANQRSEVSLKPRGDEN